MTPQELAALPQGTRVRYFVEYDLDGGGNSIMVYDYGVVGLAGLTTHVSWENGPTTLIDTKSKAWEGFIREMEIA